MSDEEYARSLSQLVDQLTVLLEAEREYETFDILHDMRETALRMADDHQRAMHRKEAA